MSPDVATRGTLGNTDSTGHDHPEKLVIGAIPVTPAGGDVHQRVRHHQRHLHHPATAGVEYFVGGVVKPAGTHPRNGTVSVTAAPQAGAAPSHRGPLH